MLMLQPRDKGMLATTLRYPYEVRAGNEIFDEIGEVKLPGEMLDIAQEIINRMSGHFEPETFTDRGSWKGWSDELGWGHPPTPLWPDRIGEMSIRQIDGKQVTMGANLQTAVQPGDTIVVRERFL